ncbi:MAG: TolB family protein [Actinomycetota bacterium]
MARRFVRAIVWTLLLDAVVVQTFALPARAYPRPGRLERLDVPTDGRPVQGCGYYSSVSADGRYVAFDTDAPFVEGDINQEVDVYLRDLKKGTTERISVGLNGSPAIGPPDEPGCLGRSLSSDPSITPDGRYVAFSSFAFNLDQGDTNGLADVFVYDRKKRVMERASVNSKAEQTEPGGLCPMSGCSGVVAGHSTRPSISADGRYVSFTSTASNLVPKDTNDFDDAFVHDRRSGKTIRVSIDPKGRESDPCPPPRGYQCSLTLGDVTSSISLNGRYVVFHSRSPDLVADDTNGIYDVFVHDLKTGRTDRVSVASDGTEAQDLQGNRASGQSGWSGSTITGWRGWAAARVISADGRFVTFVSTANNLVPNDTNRRGALTAYSFPGGGDIFVYDRKTERTERVSVASDGREQGHCVAGEAGACYTELPSISADGRYVSFLCRGGCELSRDAQRHSAVAVFDRQTGALVHAPLTKHGDASYPGLPDLSPEGRYVSFTSYYVDDDGPGPGTGSGMAFYLYDRGPALGFGGPRGRRAEETGDDRICFTPEVCIPPGGAFSKRTAHGDASNRLTPPKGVRIIAAGVAHRPRFRDLYLRLDVSEMPAVRGTPVVGDPLIVYGFRVEIEDAEYEVRAARMGGVGSSIHPAFVLFRCDGDICAEVAELDGGYGTMGDNVVTALPLWYLGLENGDRISGLTAFTAHGSYLGGELAIRDEVELI